MAAYKAGDKVELVSGGPEMAVERLGEGDKVICLWFVGGERKRGIFPSACLKPATKKFVKPQFLTS